MIVLSETLPNIDGMTYVTENDTITYFAMNGNGFELYVRCVSFPTYKLYCISHFF